MDDSQLIVLKHQEEMNRIEEQRVLTLVKTMDAKLSVDGDKYCWLYGSDLQSGIGGFGDTPMSAAYDLYYAFCKSNDYVHPRETNEGD